MVTIPSASTSPVQSVCRSRHRQHGAERWGRGKKRAADLAAFRMLQEGDDEVEYLIGFIGLIENWFFSLLGCHVVRAWGYFSGQTGGQVDRWMGQSCQIYRRAEGVGGVRGNNPWSPRSDPLQMDIQPCSSLAQFCGCTGLLLDHFHVVHFSPHARPGLWSYFGLRAYFRCGPRYRDLNKGSSKVGVRPA